MRTFENRESTYYIIVTICNSDFFFIISRHVRQFWSYKYIYVYIYLYRFIYVLIKFLSSTKNDIGLKLIEKGDGTLTFYKLTVRCALPYLCPSLKCNNFFALYYVYIILSLIIKCFLSHNFIHTMYNYYAILKSHIIHPYYLTRALHLF